jgi:signal recognition particle subunit SRP54
MAAPGDRGDFFSHAGGRIDLMSPRFQFSLQPSLESGLFTIEDLRRLVAEGLRLVPLCDETPRMRRLCGIVDSMTAAERRNPSLVGSHSRRLRIAIGAGTAPSEVAEVIRHYERMAKVLRQMAFRRHDKR